MSNSQLSDSARPQEQNTTLSGSTESNKLPHTLSDDLDFESSHDREGEARLEDDPTGLSLVALAGVCLDSFSIAPYHF